MVNPVGSAGAITDSQHITEKNAELDLQDAQEAFQPKNTNTNTKTKPDYKVAFEKSSEAIASRALSQKDLVSAYYIAGVSAFSIKSKPNYEAAFKNLSDLIKLDPKFAEKNSATYYYAGISAFSSGQPKAAFKYLTQLSKLDPSMFKSQPYADYCLKASSPHPNNIKLAREDMKNKDYSAALRHYESALEDNPNLKPILGQTIGQLDLKMASGAQKKNDMAGMLKYYEAAAKADPQLEPQLQEPISQLKPQVAFSKEQWPHISKALKEAQNMNQPPSGTGQAPDAQGAINLLESTLKKYPDMSKYTDPSVIQGPLAQYKAGMIMYPPFGEQGDPEAAINLLQSAINKYPSIAKSDPSIYYTMAQYAWGASNVSQAKKYFALLEPHIAKMASQPGNAGFVAGIAYFRGQLEGHQHSSWMTNAASWLGKITPISSNFWMNNVLSGLQSYMPDLQKHKLVGTHLMNQQLNISGESESQTNKALDEEKEQINQALQKTTDPEEIKDLNTRKEQLEKRVEKIKEARNHEGTSFSSDPDSAAQRTSYSRHGSYDLTQTRQTRDLNKDETGKSVKNDDAGIGEAGMQDPSAPGFWGMGQTLAHAQKFYKSFGVISAQNPLLLGQKKGGLDSYNMSFSGGSYFGNAEARAYKMIYGTGAGAAGVGLDSVYGADARVDAFNEEYSMNYSGGDTKIGGQDFSVSDNDALATGSLSELTAVGVQGDASGSMALGLKGGIPSGHLGGNLGGFAGAQMADQASANVLGQGGFAMAQAWAGAGAKVNAGLSFGGGGIHFDLGIGAALGVGADFQLAGNINFEAAGQDLAAIYGSTNSKFVDKNFAKMAGRGLELGADATAAAGHMAAHIGGEVEKQLGKAQDYFGEHAFHNVFHADNIGQFAEGAAEGVGELATDAADLVPEVGIGINAVKDIGGAVADVGGDLAKGEVGKAVEDTVVKGGEAIGKTLIGAAKSVINGVKNFFKGW